MRLKTPMSGVNFSTAKGISSVVQSYHRPEEYLASTRWFANLVFPPYHNASLLRCVLGFVFFPLQTILWWILAPLVWLHFCLPWPMLPRFSLRWQLWHGHSVSICNAQRVKDSYSFQFHALPRKLSVGYGWLVVLEIMIFM